jgi:hypothetical protein
MHAEPINLTTNYTAEELDAFLDEIPWKALSAAYNRRRNQKRRIYSGGRPPKLVPCPKCGDLIPTRALTRNPEKSAHEAVCRTSPVTPKTRVGSGSPRRS